MALNAVEQVAIRFRQTIFRRWKRNLSHHRDVQSGATGPGDRRARCTTAAAAKEEREEELVRLRREAVQLKKEREDIRGRVEKMLHRSNRCGSQLKLRFAGPGSARSQGETLYGNGDQGSIVGIAEPGVRVEIFDQAYNLRGSDPEYILKLAEYVDAKMRAVAEATNTIDTVRLAVLAALNIADEYHLLKKRQDNGATDYQKRAHLLAMRWTNYLWKKRLVRR